jgi:hypothetical protein
MQAIETHYKGYRFRSRLEARWAVFFDKCHMLWDYEPEGYDLGDAGWYLPDFWVPIRFHEHEGAGYWVEIKGQKTPTENEFNKARELALHTGHNTIILCGNPWPGECKYYKFNRDGGSVGSTEAFLSYPEFCDSDIRFLNTYPCDASLSRWVDRLFPANCGIPNYKKAALAARAARFEHGECPA